MLESGHRSDILKPPRRYCINRAFTPHRTEHIRWPMSVTVSYILMRHQRNRHLTRIRVERAMDFMPRAPL
ncbi:MAG: hypothetical protein E5299_01256 [Burkholderia gladioli]|nr:MAG: hypothetical protein E5299_01256 [Burkholderia gladioli]